MGTHKPDMTNQQAAGKVGEQLQVVSFCLAAEEFGVDILKVREINRMVDITRVPQAPSYLAGVINLRGKVIPIIDLRQRFGLEPRKPDNNTRIVVADNDGKVLGMIVDSVSEVLRLPSHTVEPPPPIATGISADYIGGVVKLEDRLLVLLDLAKVVNSEELVALTTEQSHK